MHNKTLRTFVYNYLRMYYTLKKNHICFKINKDCMQHCYVCNYIKIRNKKVHSFSTNVETLYKRKLLLMVKDLCNFYLVVIDKIHYVSFL